MKSDPGGLPTLSAIVSHRRARAATSDNRLSDVKCEVVEKWTSGDDDVEISEHFRVRIQTYKSWASLIARKSCTAILQDGFKADLLNDLTMIINWLSATDEESRTIVESNYDDRPLELGTALYLLNLMGLGQQRRLRGPTITAFREMIAVLCGGLRGRVPYLDSFASFTEASRFSDQEASEAIVKIVNDLLNPASNATNSSLNATAFLENLDPSEDMLDMKPAQWN